MRTIFEDTEINAELEESRAGGNKYLLLILWCVAICFLAGTWGVYRWATNKPAPEPPPPPVSLQDLKQVGTAFSTFNGFLREGKWTDAEAMLSTTARQRLATEAKTLSESLLGKSKDLKLISTDPTPSVDRSNPDVYKQDFVFVFTDQAGTKTSNEIISLALTIENGKIVINGWGEDKPQEKKPEENKADNKKA